MTARAVADLLCISQRLVNDLAQRGDLPHFRIGGAVRFSRADVEAYVRSCRVEARTPVAARPPTVTLRISDADSELRRYFERHGIKPREKPPGKAKG